MHTILAIDDTAANLGLVEMILEKENYSIFVATSGERGLEIAQREPPDIILMDIMMPGWDGFETARYIRQIPSLRHVPILFLSALDDEQSKVQAFNSGGVDYICKPFQHQELIARVKTHLELQTLRTRLEEQVAKKTQQLRKSWLDSLHLLSLASEYRDYASGIHNSRIGMYASLLSRELGCNEQDCLHILHAAPLHDTGKIGIADQILHKTENLDEDEWQIMRTHTSIGEELLRSAATESDNHLLHMAADIAGGHHEHFDGSGYPRGLQGDAIPLVARITTLCDVYDALRSQRSYKEEYSHEKTLKILLEGDERTHPEHFDPDIMQLFTQHHHRFAKIYSHMVGISSIPLMEQYRNLLEKEDHAIKQ